MPTATDLVTDLPADFEVFGQAVDTRLKALQPGTTLGDLAYSSATANTNTRLGIGSTNQVLKVTAGVPAWGSVSAGLNLITRQTFSNVANTSTTFDGVFTSTYQNYLILIDNFYGVTQADDIYFQWRYAGPTTQSSTYYWAQEVLTYAPAITSFAGNPANEIQLARNLGTSTYTTSGRYYASNVGNSSQRATLSGTTTSIYAQEETGISAFNDTARTYTGFILSSSSSNIYGTVSVYGLATS
jgi:hypothetical protein